MIPADSGTRVCWIASTSTPLIGLNVFELEGRTSLTGEWNEAVYDIRQGAVP
jgi:hypothetical protein